MSLDSQHSAVSTRVVIGIIATAIVSLIPDILHNASSLFELYYCIGSQALLVVLGPMRDFYDWRAQSRLDVRRISAAINSAKMNPAGAIRFLVPWVIFLPVFVIFWGSWPSHLLTVIFMLFVWAWILGAYVAHME
jgi:hypothetical protein